MRVWCGSLRFPVAVAADVLCDVGPLLLHAEGGASELRVTPSLPPGLDDDVGRTIVQVWNLDHAVGTALPAAASGSAWVVDHVPAGWYRVIVHHPATGTVDAGRHWVDGATPCDLGQVLLPEPATLVRADEPQSDRELYAIRTDLDVRIDGEPERLAAGEYALFWSDAGGAPHVERFAARPGHEVPLPATR